MALLGKAVKEENLIVEVFTVKSSEDIELGEIVVNDGNGILAATTSHVGPYFVAMEDHDYSEVDDHDIRCGVVGLFDVQAKPASAIVKGCYVEMSTTAGEVTDSDETAFDDIVGIGMEAAATTATHCLVLLGTFP